MNRLRHALLSAFALLVSSTTFAAPEVTEYLHRLGIGYYYGAQVSIDGKYIYAPGSLGVRILDTHSGGARILPLPDAVAVAAQSPDGKKIIAAGGRYWVFTLGWKVLNAKTGAILLEPQGTKYYTNAVAFSPDGSKILTGETDYSSSVVSCSATIWNAQTGAAIRTIPNHPGQVFSVSFSGSGNLLATGSSDGSARLWNADTGELVKTITPSGTAGYTEVQFFNNGQKLVVAKRYTSPKVYIWDLAQDSFVHTFPENSGLFSLTPDEKKIMIANKLRDVETGELIASYTKKIYGPNAFLPDGKAVLALTNTNAPDLDVFDLETGNKLASHPADAASYGQFSPDGTQVITCGQTDLDFWDAETGRRVKKIRVTTGWAELVKTGRNDELIMVHDSKKFYNFDVPHRVLLRTISIPGTPAPLDTAFSPTRNRLLVNTSDDPILIDGKTGAIVTTYPNPDDTRAYALAFSPDGTRGVILYQDSKLMIWNLTTGRVERLLQADGFARAGAITFSPDGKMIAAGDILGSVFLWKTDGTFVRRFSPGYETYVSALAFSKDGKQLVSGYGAKASVWDVESGNELRRFISPGDSIRSVAFSPDAQKVFTAGADGISYLWANPVDTSRRTLTASTGWEDYR